MIKSSGVNYCHQTLRLIATREPYRAFRDAIELHFLRTRVDGAGVTVTERADVRWQEYAEGMGAPEPFATMDPDDAQAFMDRLWDLGLRPTGAAGSAGQLGAVERHLADMRTLVFRASETT